MKDATCGHRPKDKGIASNSSKSCTAPCTAAPHATTSSGLMDLFGILLKKNTWVVDGTLQVLDTIPALEVLHAEVHS